MSRYPRAVEGSKVKCVPCNAPAVATVDGDYVCISCGERPVRLRRPSTATVERDGIGVTKSVRMTNGGVSSVKLSIESRYTLPVAVRVRETVPDAIRSSVRFRDESELARWTPARAGYEFSVIVRPGELVETGYQISGPHADAGALSEYPVIEAINLVDPEAIEAGAAPTWRSGGAAAAPRPVANNGGRTAANDRTDSDALATNGAGVTDRTAESDGPQLATVEAGDGVFAEPDEPTDVEPATDPPVLLPAGSDVEPVISVVLPTMNEEDGVGECIDRIETALRELDLPGEVIVSDSSTDRTPDIARERGAIVVEPDRTGYGYAYRYAFERARGDYVAMGDADTTYDFEELPKLFERVAEGDADLVMGSRFAGEIKPGAMPWLHRKVGNPLLTKFLNTFYHADVTDAHSGFRVIRRDALEALDLRSDGMEFASEMVMAAGERGLTIAEEPITYHPRIGEAKLESLSDGWRHVKFMLTNTPTYVFSVPAIALAAAGLLVMLLAVLDAQVFGVTFGTHAVIAGSLLTIIGYQVGSLAVFSAVAGTAIRNPGDPVTEWIKEKFTLEQGATLGIGLYAIGAVYVTVMVVRWVSTGYTNLPFVAWNMIAFTAIVLGVQTVFYSFFLSLLGQRDG